MVGFKNSIVFNQNGKVVDYQKSYNKEYDKTLSVFLPLNFNNKKHYRAELSISLNNTYPKQIEIVEGYKCEDDLNKYEFNLTQLYLLDMKKKLGLCRFKLYSDNGKVRFESESFRL